MVVDSIHSTICSILSQYSTSSTSTSTDSSSSSSTSSSTSSSSTSTATKKYADTWKGQIEKQVDQLLSLVPNDGGKLSMDDVIAYRDSLREGLYEQVKEDLEKLGVDTEQDINLSYDSSSGKVVCVSDIDDKDIIDRYFAANSDLCEDYKNALQLTKLTASAESQLTPTQMRSSLQQQALSVWLSQDTSASTSFTGTLASSFNSEFTSLGGLNLTV